MKFIRHKEGIVHCDQVREITVEEILPSPQTGHLSKWAVCFHVDNHMKIVECYKTIEEAEKELELFYQKLESPALPSESANLVKLGDVICDSRLIQAIDISAERNSPRLINQGDFSFAVNIYLGAQCFQIVVVETKAEAQKKVKEIAEKLGIDGLCS